MSEIKRLPNLLLKPFNLISYVQELSQRKQYQFLCLLYPKLDWLISNHGLKRVQKINPGVFTI